MSNVELANGSHGPVQEKRATIMHRTGAAPFNAEVAVGLAMQLVIVLFVSHFGTAICFW